MSAPTTPLVPKQVPQSTPPQTGPSTSSNPPPTPRAPDETKEVPSLFELVRTDEVTDRKNGDKYAPLKTLPGTKNDALVMFHGEFQTNKFAAAADKYQTGKKKGQVPNTERVVIKVPLTRALTEQGQAWAQDIKLAIQHLAEFKGQRPDVKNPFNTQYGVFAYVKAKVTQDTTFVDSAGRELPRMNIEEMLQKEGQNVFPAGVAVYVEVVGVTFVPNAPDVTMQLQVTDVQIKAPRPSRFLPNVDETQATDPLKKRQKTDV